MSCYAVRAGASPHAACLATPYMISQIVRATSCCAVRAVASSTAPCSAMLCTLLPARVCHASLCFACSCQPVRARSCYALRASDNASIPCLAMRFPAVAGSFMACSAMPRALVPTHSRHALLCRACSCQLARAMSCCAACARPSPSLQCLPIPCVSMRCVRATSCYAVRNSDSSFLPCLGVPRMLVPLAPCLSHRTPSCQPDRVMSRSAVHARTSSSGPCLVMLCVLVTARPSHVVLCQRAHASCFMPCAATPLPAVASSLMPIACLRARASPFVPCRAMP